MLRISFAVSLDVINVASTNTPQTARLVKRSHKHSLARINMPKIASTPKAVTGRRLEFNNDESNELP